MFWTYVVGREWYVFHFKSSEKDGDKPLSGQSATVSCLGQWSNLVSGILGERCHNQWRAICVDIKKLTQWIWRVWPDMRMSQVLQHDSARPHTSLCTREAVATVVLIVLPHPPYSPDFAPSDFHLFGPLKDAIWRCYFVNDSKLKHSVCEELWCFGTEYKFFHGQRAASYAKVEKVC